MKPTLMPGPPTPEKRDRIEARLPLFIFILAAVLRVITRLVQGEEQFWSGGYTQYVSLAGNLWQTGDYIVATDFGDKAAFWPPVYPVFLMIGTCGGQYYIPMVVLGGLVGGLTAFVTFKIGSEVFSDRTAMIAAALVSIYPYYVVHDTAIQDTALFTCLTALSVFALLRALRTRTGSAFFLAGCAVGLAVLTRASLLPYVVLLILFVGAIHTKKLPYLLIGLVLVTSPWIIRNQVVLGTPTLTTQTGRFLWIANNPYTFSHYPQDSIDLSEAEAWRRLPPEEKVDILKMDEWGQEHHFRERGFRYLVDDPIRALNVAAIKIWAAFGWQLSPRSPGLKQTVYSLSYLPILGFALVGLYLARDRWRRLSPIYLLFIAFVLGTAVFWAHTSHRVYLDIYLMLFAAFAAVNLVHKLGIDVDNDALTADEYRSHSSRSVRL